MRILKDGAVCGLKMREGWQLKLVSKPYYDFEKILLTMPTLEKAWEGDVDHIISQITFEQDDDLKILTASLTVSRNVPHGDHEELMTMDISIEEALAQVFDYSIKGA